MTAEERLAELEERVKRAEQNLKDTASLAAKLGKDLGQERESAKMERDHWDAIQTNSLKLTAALENQIRERNERILQLEKDADFGKRFRELLETVNPAISAEETRKVDLTNVKYSVAVKDEVRKVDASDTTTCRGRLLKLMKDGFFDKRRVFGDISDEFPRRGWPDSDKTISNTLTTMFNDSLIAKDRKDEKSGWEYFKPGGVVFE